MPDGIGTYNDRGPEAARPLLEAELAADPDNVLVRFYLSACMTMARGDTEDIRAAALAAIGRVPDAERLQILGQCEFDVGEIEAGIEHLEQSLHLEPGNSFYKITLAARLDSWAEFESRARTLYEEVLEEDPRCLDALLAISGSVAEENPNRALELADRALASCGSPAEEDARRMALYHKARALAYKEEYCRAIDVYEELLRIHSDHDKAWLGLASCLIAEGRIEEAKEILQSVSPAEGSLREYRDAQMQCVREMRPNATDLESE